ncbi:serine protease [Brevundimonas sp.]|uniref:S1 family peptidase n=1 Tax=Brevundimonas sp. TaxID=1871086 RepID=UPI0028AD7394|nr:serine protease [Brevundimonas sp.]
MRLPRLPDWAVYAAVAGVLLAVSLSRRENADAPPAAAVPADAVEGALLGPITPFDAAATVEAPDAFRPSSGTAFSIAGRGRWVTARHVVEGCRKPALVIGSGRAVAADVRLASRADVALLITDGGPPALPVAAEAPLRKGQRAFHPGFPQGAPGEVTTRLLGRETLKVFGRGAHEEPVLAWAEVGRTDGLVGALSGLSGAPALDGQGRVLGVTIAEAPRRGRIYTTAPESFGPAIRGEQGPDEAAQGQPMTIDTYGQASDALRRDLRVAQVVCLSA